MQRGTRHERHRPHRRTAARQASSCGALRAGGMKQNHAEGIAVTTAVTAGGLKQNHAEGVVR
jgi:hypothetical protein